MSAIAYHFIEHGYLYGERLDVWLRKTAVAIYPIAKIDMQIKTETHATKSLSPWVS